jgi:zinc protease
MYAKKIKEKKFPWGGKALVAAFPSKDVVSLVGSITGGSRAWGSEEEADVHAQMLLEGTKHSTKKQLQQKLDTMGASLSFAAGSERLYFIGKVRPVHLDNLLGLIAECLLESTFPEPELAVLKMREAADLELESQNTNAQAITALTQMLFKPLHPNYGETTRESVKILKGINAKRLREVHAKLLNKKSLLVSLAGDVSFGKATTLISKNFKVLPTNVHAFKSFPKSAPYTAKKAQIHIQNKASIDYVTGIATGITSDAKEYPALLLGLQILGNRGFASRLMKTVREEEGLTYGVYAYASGMKSVVDGYLYIGQPLRLSCIKKEKSPFAAKLIYLLVKVSPMKRCRNIVSCMLQGKKYNFQTRVHLLVQHTIPL